MKQEDLRKLLELMEYVKLINCDIIHDEGEVFPGTTLEEFESLEGKLRFEILNLGGK